MKKSFIISVFVVLSLIGSAIFYALNSKEVFGYLGIHITVFLIFFIALTIFEKNLKFNYNQAGLIYIGTTFTGLLLTALTMVVLTKMKIISLNLLISFGSLFLIYMVLGTLITQKQLAQHNPDKKQ